MSRVSEEMGQERSRLAFCDEAQDAELKAAASMDERVQDAREEAMEHPRWPSGRRIPDVGLCGEDVFL